MWQMQRSEAIAATRSMTLIENLTDGNYSIAKLCTHNKYFIMLYWRSGLWNIFKSFCLRFIWNAPAINNINENRKKAKRALYARSHDLQPELVSSHSLVSWRTILIWLTSIKYRWIKCHSFILQGEPIFQNSCSNVIFVHIWKTLCSNSDLRSLGWPIS